MPDNDDDNDGWKENSTESLCFTSSLSSNSVPKDTDGDKTCDVNDPDMDGDNVINEQDAFPLDISEWEDRNNDGKGDNAYPLSITDKMSLNPVPTFLISLTIIALIGGAVLVYTNQQKSSKDDIYKGTDMTSYTESQELVNDELPPLPEDVDEVVESENIVSEETIISSEKTNIPPPPPEMPPIKSNIPPPPPGFEPVITEEKANETVSSWEELPPGGDYTETDPLTYTGPGIGTWVERDDESWEKISN